MSTKQIKILSFIISVFIIFSFSSLFMQLRDDYFQNDLFSLISFIALVSLVAFSLDEKILKLLSFYEKNNNNNN
jgi:hypothetical protein